MPNLPEVRNLLALLDLADISPAGVFSRGVPLRDGPHGTVLLRAIGPERPVRTGQRATSAFSIAWRCPIVWHITCLAEGVLKPAKEPTTLNSEVVVTVRASRLEGDTLTTLKVELQFLTQAGRNLTLDFSAVKSVNANAAKVIVEANARLQKRGGSLQLTGIQNAVAAYFELLRVHRQLRMSSAAAAPDALPMAA